MRTFTPIVVQKDKGLVYNPLTIEKAIIFGERNKEQKIIFETESFGVKEQLTLEQLKEIKL